MPDNLLHVKGIRRRVGQISDKFGDVRVENRRFLLGHENILLYRHIFPPDRLVRIQNSDRRSVIDFIDGSPIKPAAIENSRLLGKVFVRNVVVAENENV